jgi:micrococcal nuclease
MAGAKRRCGFHFSFQLMLTARLLDRSSWAYHSSDWQSAVMKPPNRNRTRPRGDTWSSSGNRRRLETMGRGRSPAWHYAATGLGLGALLGIGIFMWPVRNTPETALSSTSIQHTFGLCHTGGGTNCVVDGDTIWLDGSKIRIADIDAPETHDPKCSSELDLGNRATKRLHELVNLGPFDVSQIGNRDQDKYGRSLRVLVRSGQSLGAILVNEGLARTWDGSRHPWC